VLSDVPKPEPAAGQLLVRILACAINYPDVLIIEDKYQTKPDRPFSPGSEISGIVEQVGAGVSDWKSGDLLIAVPGHGGLAEYICIPASIAFHVSNDVDPAEAASLLLTYATTIHALSDRGALQQGETLLVLGAAGGVGLAAIEIGKALGARVIAAVSSAEKADAARTAGADETVIYPRGPFDKDGIKALAALMKNVVGSTGADVIYDPVGGEYTEAALRCVAWGGRYLVIGFPAGIPKLPLNLTLLKGCDVKGVYWGSFAERRPEANRRNVEQLIDWWTCRKIRPHVGKRWHLTQGGEAISWLSERNAIGKAVVVIPT
jgi:NADPH:quinone reductase-like Zn-dependent oxidoreductase